MLTASLLANLVCFIRPCPPEPLKSARKGNQARPWPRVRQYVEQPQILPLRIPCSNLYPRTSQTANRAVPSIAILVRLGLEQVFAMARRQVANRPSQSSGGFGLQAPEPQRWLAFNLTTSHTRHARDRLGWGSVVFGRPASKSVSGPRTLLPHCITPPPVYSFESVTPSQSQRGVNESARLPSYRSNDTRAN